MNSVATFLTACRHTTGTLVYIQSIHKYSEYLQRSSKKSCLNQSRLSPVRKVAENISFQFIPQCSNPEPLLNELCEECDDYEYLPVENFLPTSSGKYNYLKTLKDHGLPFLAALVTYAHGLRYTQNNLDKKT